MTNPQSPALQAEAAEPVSTSAADGQTVALNTHVIYDCLSHDAKRRTSWKNVEDVLSTVRTRHGLLYTHPSPQVSPSQDGGASADGMPIDMVLHCPACGLQHIDAPEGGMEAQPDGTTHYEAAWTNPPHRSHLCHGCGHVWRPADVPTNGVVEVKTRGKADSATPGPRGENAGGVRKLTDAELRAAWEACDETGYLEWGAVVMRAFAEANGLRIAEKGDDRG